MIKESLIQLTDDITSLCFHVRCDAPAVVLVSKFISREKILEAYDAGQRMFGENRVQELLEKKRQLPDDIKWHFVGHLQTNKVKDIIGTVALIHSVDSLHLAELIDREASKKGIRQACLLQVNTSCEDTKHGIAVNEVLDTYNIMKHLQHIEIDGLMTIGAFTDDASLVRDNFKTLRLLRDQIIEHDPASRCKELSMGMSGDWKIALEEGATYVRIGSLVFGER